MSEAKKTDAWMPLWIGDYLADTMSLTRDEHGAYLLLLFAYWRNKGPLKNDEKSLASIVKSSPLEWRKKLSEKMQEFFEIQDGYLVHHRADKELKKAGIFAMKAHTRAVKAAAARWGKKEPAQSTEEGCLEHASSIAQAVLNPCPSPSPSPSPSIGIHTDVAKDELKRERESAPAENSESVSPSVKTQCCIAMRKRGLASLNTEHPELQALVDQGATPELFAEATTEAIKAGKGKFGYILGKVKGQMSDAAAIRQTSMSHPNTRQTTETDHQRQQREHVEALAPRAARKAPGEARNPFTIDITELRNVTAIANR